MGEALPDEMLFGVLGTRSEFRANLGLNKDELPVLAPCEKDFEDDEARIKFVRGMVGGEVGAGHGAPGPQAMPASCCLDSSI